MEIIITPEVYIKRDDAGIKDLHTTDNPES